MTGTIPLCIPDLGGNEGRYLQECVDTNFVSSVGPFVTRFEAMVAAHAGSAGAVATSAGTTALHVALVALGVAPGDLVIVPSFSFIASANAIAHCGALPWLVDIDPATWTLAPALLAQVLERDCERRGGALVHRASGRRVAAMMPVYTLGLPADMDAIVGIADRHGLPAVADAAAAIGATCKGRPIGALGARLSCLSFNGNKTITAGGGGAVVGDDAELLALVRHLTTTARVGRDYDHDRVGFNYRMTNVTAAVGCAQMERVEALVAAKRRIRAAYDAALAGLPGIGPFPAPPWAKSAAWFSGVVADDAALAERLRGRLAADGIEARRFWKPIHLQPPFAAAPRTAMPVAEGLWQRVVILPCSTNLGDDALARVIASVNAAVGG